MDQPAELRREFLVRACQGNQSLLETVAKLLAVQERGAGLLDTPVFQRKEASAKLLEPGASIGPYKILQQLGSGGMGIVYQVVRADEVFQRVCALKIIRPELSTAWLLERFRKERHILARLDHPNIARIMDGGSTPESIPYFVMDYVDGQSINDYCRQHKLQIRRRLSLFQQVCGAVQYLHQNGVIHGDLKPPNILIANDGSIKLVDFGIASALSTADSTSQSAPMPLMTLGYASPEQMHGQKLTPLTDVYSLGVILYELLSGTPPFQTGALPRSEVVSAITTKDPVPPSAAVVRDASLPFDSADSRHQLRGDLDSIVLLAMHRNPALRYQSVTDLNEDITLYLQVRPVTARSSGILYRGRKFIARQRRSLLAASLIAVLLAANSWELLKIHEERKVSRQDEQKVQELQRRLSEEEKQRMSAQTQRSRGETAAEPVPPSAQLRSTELHHIGELAEAYRTLFMESVRLWPGMTRNRRDLLDQADSYLRQAEPYVDQDPTGREQLAKAWLWLANVEGNPRRVNLQDRAGAKVSINEAKRLIGESSVPSETLADTIKEAAAQIEGVEH